MVMRRFFSTVAMRFACCVLQLVLECLYDLCLKLQLGYNSQSLIIQSGNLVSKVVHDDIQWNFE